jgi:hypothetical protein
MKNTRHGRLTTCNWCGAGIKSGQFQNHIKAVHADRIKVR